jgi:catechol 2,3-dioxygenase
LDVSAPPQTNFTPPFNVTRASHLVLTARDLARSRDFYVEVLGLMVSEEDASTIYLRGTEEIAHHSLTLKKTDDAAACERVGLRVFTDEDLDKAKAYFDRKGIAAQWQDVPFQGRTLQVSDAAGAPLEFCARMQTQPRAQTKIHRHKGAGALRMDHFQVLVPDVAQAAAFYTDLGFRVSDYISVEATGRMVGVFMYRKDNPHDMAFLQRSGPRYHHCGYMIQEFHHMVRACDVAGNLGFGDAIEHGPGRHGLGHSYYTYLRDPDGHRVELLLPAVQMIDIDEAPVRHLAMPNANSNLWGLPAPRSWVEEATPFAGVEIGGHGADSTRMTLESWLAARRVPVGTA